MGIFDFLGDLSSKRSKELGLGGLQSLLGTRRAAQAGAIGDEMIGITNKDSLPGYFNEQTREYVPWYVDLFDGGGLNASGTVAEQEAAQSMAARTMPGGAPMAQPGLLRPRLRPDPLEPFGGAGPNIPEGLLGPFGGAGPAIQDTPDTSYYTPPSSMQMPSQITPGSGSQPSNMESARFDEAKRRFEVNHAANTMSNLNDPRLKLESTGYGRSPYILDRLTKKTDLGAAGYGPMGQTMQPSMMQHPEFPQFVELIKKAGNESVLQNPEQTSFVFNNYLKQIGYN